MHTWTKSVLENLINRLDILIRGGVENNNHGTDETDCTAQLSQGPKFLFEKVGSEDSTDEDAEGSQGSNQNCRRKGVSGKVANFSYRH